MIQKLTDLNKISFIIAISLISLLISQILTLLYSIIWLDKILISLQIGALIIPALAVIPLSISAAKSISENRKARNEIEEKNKILETTIIDLKKAREEAIYQARSKSEFLANMSHEIRTPLNAIIGMSSLLSKTKLNEDQNEYINTIRTSGDSLLGIINDILDFSKIESGKMQFEHIEFNIRDCIEESLDLISPNLKDFKINLAYFIDENVVETVKGDIGKLRQVLINLLSNAVKFTSQGEIIVSVKQVWEKDNLQRLYFSVKDTGIGISKDKINILFKPFTQADASTTRKYGGTGLGLVICSKIIELMNGQIWVDSKENHGSNFQFEIELPTYKPENVSIIISDQTLEGKKILIVDDNETNRKLLRIQTERWGMLPTLVSSGKEAIDLIENGETFDIGILDFQMPDLDGKEVAMEIRKQKNSKDLPLLMLSSIGIDPAEFKDVNFSRYMNKPIKPNILNKILIDILYNNKPSIKSDVEKLDNNLASKDPLDILIVEDNMINQKVALQMIKNFGYSADIAANGIEALESLERQTYDIIFMDIQMPEMDGEEATKRIREKFNNHSNPWIVAMTAHALSGDREKYLKAGMNDYISKPVRPPEIAKAIYKFLEFKKNK